MVTTRGQPSELREAYLATSRVRIASNVARLSAAGLLVGLVGTIITWWHRSALFDLASTPTLVNKPGPGFLVGPVLILALLPLVGGASPRLALKRLYRVRVGAAAFLWAAGLAILIGDVSSLDGYTIQAGAYIAAALLSVGLVATLAMWPAGLAVVRVDRSNRVQEEASG